MRKFGGGSRVARHSAVSGLRFAVADARDLSPVVPDGSVAAILDKGTLDAICCGDGFDYARSAVAANRAAGATRAADLVVTPGPYGKRPFILCEDPQEVGRNITASAYRFKEVRALFRAANEALSLIHI